MIKKIVICVMIILSACTGTMQAQDTFHEPYRPQYHFSPVCGWMNDPNGMVYYEGEYHLFYQYNPKIEGGNQHWGHAVSTDLIHWQTLPIALYPDDIGAIWSGSAVIDANNTSGLVPGGGLVAIFSYQNQSQGIAYSTDKGRTWTKYDGNPVIPAMAKDFRDPKVFWNDATKLWTMVLAAGHEVQFYTSPNLIDWEKRSSFSGGQTLPIWEVPDLFPLQLDGQTKWVLLNSLSAGAPSGGNGIQYFVGNFDGTTFTSDNPTGVQWLDYGSDNYAGTTWNNAPDGQRLYIGWMSNWAYAFNLPTPTWRGATTLPREFKLVNTPDGIRLSQSIPAAFESLRHPLGTWDNVALSGEVPLDAKGRTLEIIAEFQPGDATRIGLDLQSGDSGRTRILYNTKMGQLLVSRPDTTAAGTIGKFTTAFGAPLRLGDGTLRLHIYLDESSVEVLAQDGLISMSALTFTDPQNDGLAAFAEGGSATLKHVEVYALDSIWNQTADQIAQAKRDNECP